MKYTSQAIRFLAIFAMLTLTACGGTALASSQANSDPTTVPQATAIPQATATPIPYVSAPPMSQDPLGSFETTYENVYNQVNPSVVYIAVTLNQQSSLPSSSPFFSPGQQNQTPQYTQASGSGFVLDTQGDIVTNNHVVDGAVSIDVTFSDGTTMSGKVIGADPQSDLAVVKVDVPASQLNPVKIADSSTVKIGQIVIAIGNPFGLQGTMTVGIISGLGRSLPVNQGSATVPTGPVYTIPDIIQTDAAINPGNSGGVLVNDSGEVIGVTSAIESPVRANSGVGFVIPSAIVSRIVPVLIQTGHYDHPYIGISGTSLTPDLAKAMNLDANQRGALVIDVVSNGPANKAGMKGSNQQTTMNGQQAPVGGDVIVAVDGQTIKSMDDLIAYLFSNTAVGQTVTVTVLRDGKQMNLDVPLEARPANSPTQSSAWLGIDGIAMTTDIAQAMGYSTNPGGVLIQTVEANSPADQAGLQGSSKTATVSGKTIKIGGDILMGMDGYPVKSMSDVQDVLSQVSPGDQMVLTVLRGNNQGDVLVTLGTEPTQ
jgi:serine protease Do